MKGRPAWRLHVSCHLKLLGIAMRCGGVVLAWQIVACPQMPHCFVPSGRFARLAAGCLLASRMGFFPCRAARKPEADSAQESLMAAAYKHDNAHDFARCRVLWDIGPFFVLYGLYVTCLERAKELGHRHSAVQRAQSEKTDALHGPSHVFQGEAIAALRS